MSDFLKRKHRFEVTDGWQLCNWCGRPKESDLHYKAPAGWQPIETAPKNATEIEVIMFSGTIQIAHWAQDLSGEEQPPFRGWFIRRGKGFAQIDEPAGWRWLEDKNDERRGSLS